MMRQIESIKRIILAKWEQQPSARRPRTVATRRHVGEAFVGLVFAERSGAVMGQAIANFGRSR